MVQWYWSYTYCGVVLLSQLLSTICWKWRPNLYVSIHTYWSISVNSELFQTCLFVPVWPLQQLFWSWACIAMVNEIIPLSILHTRLVGWCIVCSTHNTTLGYKVLCPCKHKRKKTFIERSQTIRKTTPEPHNNGLLRPLQLLQPHPSTEDDHWLVRSSMCFPIPLSLLSSNLPHDHLQEV